MVAFAYGQTSPKAFKGVLTAPLGSFASIVMPDFQVRLVMHFLLQGISFNLWAFMAPAHPGFALLVRRSFCFER
ncbi:MAG: hypothetical protein IPN86_11550 [Saprospiraceae bacterium]|nr:hypothetical protein [Saprospiraceae bacterium]